MAFPESIKLAVKRRAHFQCCLCKALGVEVHHIIPQEASGSDDEDNAAPLCPSCHEAYGANPTKRKFIREARDLWYEICQKRFASDASQLSEIKELLRQTARSEELAGLKAEIFEYVRQSMPLALPTEAKSQRNEGNSPSGHLRYEVHIFGDDRAEVWLSEEGSPEWVKLCNCGMWRNLQLHFSPNDSWIILRNGGPSMGISLDLFRRTGGANFQLVEDAAIGDKAEQFAFGKGGMPQASLHHRYVNCLSWSPDSRAVLIRVSGYGNGEYETDVAATTPSQRAFGLNWVGLYDVELGTITTDLELLNREAAQTWLVERLNVP